MNCWNNKTVEKGSETQIFPWNLEKWGDEPGQSFKLEIYKIPREADLLGDRRIALRCRTPDFCRFCLPAFCLELLILDLSKRLACWHRARASTRIEKALQWTGFIVEESVDIERKICN
jgi:hypothetical protein